MKKNILLYATAGLLMLSSCDLDINEDPNYPKGKDVTPDLVLPAAENFIANALGDQMFTYAGFFAQYFEQRPEQNQYNTYAELHLDEGSNTLGRCYRNLFAGAMKDLLDITSRSNNAADKYICTILRVWSYQLFTDNVSDAPYTEALKGSSLPNPKWDDGKTVMEGVLSELDQAEAALGSASITLKDPLMEKNLSQWKGFANALRLRIYLRMIDGGIDAAGYTAKAKALVAANAFFTDDVKFDVYTNAEGQYSSWYGSIFRLKANNYVAAYPIVAYYQATSDPRISYALLQNKDNAYVGQLPGSKTRMKEWTGKTWKNDYVSEINTDAFADAPVYVFTQSELQFLIAEVQLRFNNDVAAAKTAYEAAVTADFASRGMAGKAAAFLTGPSVDFAAQATDADRLKLIYMQKWAAFFMRNHMEAWSEIRRTDVPAISGKTAQEIYTTPSSYTAGDMIIPAVNYIQAGGLAKRVPYPQNARRLNTNTPAAKLMSDRVFWDAH
ncbi:SusD/RagB family nutrient-binding outer membrane lipoprotein [Hoylesella marshii]|uniref:SusD/RagB family nutrient-binding outer membrane lipoprotein n=1 Tax=Hoylesella marshii TaxID=189722 RepID=UPI0028D0B94A|nr:SusD/RagB family nutrient-binding outer membrane lipoprotein [Hoylesella marshii]